MCSSCKHHLEENVRNFLLQYDDKRHKLQNERRLFTNLQKQYYTHPFRPLSHGASWLRTKISVSITEIRWAKVCPVLTRDGVFI